MAGKKGYKRTITLAFDYSSVKQAVPDINRALSELNADFKAQASAAEAAGKKVDKLGLNYDKARKSIDLNKQKVALLKEELHKLEGAESRNEKAISRKRIELKRAEKDLNDATASAKKFGDELAKQNTIFGVSSEKVAAFGDKLTSVGRDLTTKVTLPILALGAGAVKLASDLEETMSKVEQVFETNADGITQWANTSIEKMGLAKQTALDMASSFGDLGAGMGLSLRQNTEYAKSLTQLAADMASFKNVKVEVAQTALTGIFTGETESLKKMGVVMTEANLQQFAYSQGIQKRISDMSQAEKVQLRYNFVMDATAKAHGDFERTGGSAANQARIFKEAIKELGAAFGAELLPIITPIIAGLTEVIKTFSKLPEPAKRIILIIAGVAAVLGPLLFMVGSVAKAVTSVTDAFAKVPKAALEASNTIGKIAGSVKAASSPFAYYTMLVIAAAAAVWALVEALNFLFRGQTATGNMLEKAAGLARDIRGAKHRSYAVGTHYAPGGSARLHEYGDEIVDLPRGSRVYTADQSKRMVENQRKDDSRTADLLQSLIDRVDRMTSKVERLPDRQLALSRE